MIQTTVLPNGVHVISHQRPTQSAALGVWLLNGGRHQQAEECGYAHLFEHLVFKGTRERDTQGLARRFEAMGGQINAHTGRELTALHGLVPAENVLELLALFSAMLAAPVFSELDVETERGVVLQEMAMIEDDPGEALEEAALAQFWPDHALGWPILGCREVIEQVNAAAVRRYFGNCIVGQRLWVVAVGKVDHARLVEACTELGSLQSGAAPEQAAPRHKPVNLSTKRRAAQSHLLWVMPGSSASDEQVPGLMVANQILGGGTSSRLFQELRERQGLVYGIQSRLEHYSDTGLWLIQTACDVRQKDICREAVEDIVRQLVADGPTAQELDDTRQHLRASLLLDEDDLSSYMERLAHEAIYLRRHPPLAERARQLAAVMSTDVRRLMGHAFRDKGYFELI